MLNFDEKEVDVKVGNELFNYEVSVHYFDCYGEDIKIFLTSDKRKMVTNLLWYKMGWAYS